MSDILEDIETTEFDHNLTAQFGVKSAILWGNSKKNGSTSPLLYISKPKWVSREDFEFLLTKLTVLLER